MNCCVITRVLARPFPKGTVPFGGSNVYFGSATKETMCPFGFVHLKTNKSHLNLKICLGSEYIELSGLQTELKYFVDSGTHSTSDWY